MHIITLANYKKLRAMKFPAQLALNLARIEGLTVSTEPTLEMLFQTKKRVVMVNYSTSYDYSEYFN